MGSFEEYVITDLAGFLLGSNRVVGQLSLHSYTHTHTLHRLITRKLIYNFPLKVTVHQLPNNIPTNYLHYLYNLPNSQALADGHIIFL